MTVIFTGADIFSQGCFHSGCDLILNNDLVADILPTNEVTTKDKIDITGLKILPGLIDLQVNGCGGITFNDDPSIHSLEHMEKTSWKFGTTTILPTLVTCHQSLMEKALKATREYHQSHGIYGIPGIHLEGPFISQKKSGIHDKNYVRTPNKNDMLILLEYSHEIGLLTATPDAFTEDELSMLKNAGIHLSVGHSSCTYDEVNDKIKNYFTVATHLFNAMTSINDARTPGIMVSVQENSLYAGIIADGCHVHPALIRMSAKLLKNRLFLVTDALAAAGASDEFSEFNFCGKKLYVRNEGFCSDENGTLGGSCLTMNEGIRKLTSLWGFSKEEAINMATSVPAQAGGFNNIGDIKKGYQANLFICDDNFHGIMSYVNGMKVFSD